MAKNHLKWGGIGLSLALMLMWLIRESVIILIPTLSIPNSLATRITEDKRNNPLVMCKIPVIKNILSWKCPNPSTVTSPKPQNSTLQNNSPASTSQPVKK